MPVTIGVGATIAVLAALPDVRPWLVDSREAVARLELWRLWSGHLLHASTTHLAFNLALFLPLSAIRERRVGTRRHGLELLLVALAVAIGIRLLHPGWSTYQGMSGVVYGLVPLVLLRPPLHLPSLMIIAVLGLKSVGELQGGGWLMGGDGLSDLYGIRYLAGSHCAGIFAGVLLAIRWRRAPTLTEVRRPQPSGSEANELAPQRIRH